MEQHNRIKNIACFLTEYSTALLACGSSSVRIEKNVARIAETYDVKAELSILTNHIILTVWDNKSDHSYSNVGKTKNSTISFYINTELSRLSWRIHDNYLELEKACKEYDRIINHPKINRWLVLLLVGFANASFCKLFGGDLISMGIVFSATITGFYLKQQMQKKKLNHYIVFIVSAFVASLCASTALIFDTTSEIAMATSVLYLVPGVPLINGVIDIVEGYVLTGFARLTEASLLIVSIAIGLSFILLMVKNSLI